MSSLQDLFAERRLKCEKDKEQKQIAEKAAKQAKAAALRAKNEARKQAIIDDPTSAAAVQARYAEEERQRLANEKRERQVILQRIEADKLARKERATGRVRHQESIPKDQDSLAASLDNKPMPDDRQDPATPSSLLDFATGAGSEQDGLREARIARFSS